MIANATTHRRANAFAQALDARGTRPNALDEQADRARQSPAPGRESEPSEGVTPKGATRAAERYPDPTRERMLTLANALETLPAPALDPEVKRAQRARLMAAAEAAFGGDGSAHGRAPLPEQRARGGRSPSLRFSRFRPRTRWGRRLAVSGLAVGIAAGGLSGAAVASSDALPGDTLYGLKRSMEDLRLTMADGDTDRGDVYLDMASTRLNEARRLMERSKSGELSEDQVRDVRRALAGMQEEAAQGHDLLSRAYQHGGSLRPMKRLAAFSDSQRKRWLELSPRLPAELATVRDDVSSVLDAIERDVVPLRSLFPEESSDAKAGRENAVPGAGQRLGHSPSSAPTPSSTSPQGEVSQKPEGTPSDSSGSPTTATSPGQSGLLPGGLLGGVGDTPPPSTSTTPEDTADEGQEREVTVPPLLPDLLPGLGFGTSDAE